MPVCDMDFRVGGKYRFMQRSPDGYELASQGVYTLHRPARAHRPDRILRRRLDARAAPTTCSSSPRSDGRTTATTTVTYATPEARAAAAASPMATGMEIGFSGSTPCSPTEQASRLERPTTTSTDPPPHMARTRDRTNTPSELETSNDHDNDLPRPGRHPRLRTIGASSPASRPCSSSRAPPMPRSMRWATIANDGTVGSDPQLAVALAYRTAITVLGGWLAARLAPSHAAAPRARSSAPSAPSSPPSCAVTACGSLGHNWYAMSLAILAMPSTALGGWLFTRRVALNSHNKETRK